MNNRSMASLTPTLLARKGAARPAMRPQLQPMRQFHENTARQLDDLGWNDMGHDAEASAPAEPAPEPVEPAQEPKGAQVVAFNPTAEPAPAQVPEVVRQQEAIATRVAEEPARPRRSALADGRRAAFTLRLDGERHLKLRLACVTTGRSAQQLVTEALDRLIADLPEVAELAAKVRKRR
jgi:hypothetical protein